MMIVSTSNQRQERPFINHSSQAYDNTLRAQQRMQHSHSRSRSLSTSESLKQNLEGEINDTRQKISDEIEVKSGSEITNEKKACPCMDEVAQHLKMEQDTHLSEHSVSSEIDSLSSPLSLNTMNTETDESENSQQSQETAKSGTDTKTGTSNDVNSRNSSQGVGQYSQVYQKDPPRKRRRTSPDELQILEREFAHNRRPCKEDRERIAALTSKDEKAVQVWFQNKRQSCRRQQSGSGMMPAMVRPTNMQMFQDENWLTQTPVNAAVAAVPLNQRPLQLVQSGQTQQPTSLSTLQAKRSKSLKLSMSADGKAEIVERSPLKALNYNTVMPAQRFATMPVFTPNMTGYEQECASSLLVLKSGQWK